MPEVVVNEKDVEWVKPPTLPSMAAKVLALDKETKAHAMLVRWDPGWYFHLTHTRAWNKYIR